MSRSDRACDVRIVVERADREFAQPFIESATLEGWRNVIVSDAGETRAKVQPAVTLVLWTTNSVESEWIATFLRSELENRRLVQVIVQDDRPDGSGLIVQPPDPFGRFLGVEVGMSELAQITVHGFELDLPLETAHEALSNLGGLVRLHEKRDAAIQFWTLAWANIAEYAGNDGRLLRSSSIVPEGPGARRGELFETQIGNTWRITHPTKGTLLRVRAGSGRDQSDARSAREEVAGNVVSDGPFTYVDVPSRNLIRRLLWGEYA